MVGKLALVGACVISAMLAGCGTTSLRHFQISDVIVQACSPARVTCTPLKAQISIEVSSPADRPTPQWAPIR
jgi:hypothetical protein